ncbi:MAG: amino acid adenylation domain-containing protein [Planctomycetia bacterium]|nr:amino acid adenylation domain-containing protein [Planctomycetia bacterium]
MSNAFALLGSQNAILTQWKMEPSSTCCNLPFWCEIPDNIPTSLFLDALKTITGIYPQLRTAFETGTDGAFYQRVLSQGNPVERIETTETELNAVLTRLIRPFDLLTEIPVRFALITTEKKRYFFHDIHHISLDGIGYASLLADLERILRGESPQGEKIPLAECVQMEQRRREENLANDFAFFDSVLANQPDFDFPALPVRGASQIQQFVQTWDGQSVRDFLNSDSGHSLTPNVLFISALAFVLSRFSRENCASFCMVINGRPCREAFATLGGFSRAIPMATAPIPDETVRHFWKRNQTLIRETLHRQTPTTGELLHRYGLTPGLFYVYQKGVENRYQGTLPMRRLPLSDAAVPFVLEIYERENVFEVRAEYDAGIYGVDVIEALFSSWQTVLRTMIEQPEQLCGQIETVDKTQRENLLALGRGETIDFDEQETIIDCFRRQAASCPDRIAVVFQETKVTYDDLDKLTDRLAAHLAEWGVGPEKNVGIMIDRSELLAVYPLAVLKAGGCYVPLDPHFPEDRLNYMIGDAQIEIILTEKELAQKAVPHFNGRIFDASELNALPDPEILPPGPKPEDAFVIIFTSGTTGKPKGCILEHRNLMNFCIWHTRYFALTPSDRAGAYSNFSFDAHLFDFYPNYMAGSSVYVIPSEMRLNLPDLAQYFSENHLSLTALTTRVGQKLAEFWPHSLSKALVVGGEALTFAHVPNCRFENAYGPTECTNTSTIYKLNQDEELPSIGRPITNYTAYVADSSGSLLPRGVSGELWIGGKGVARGYMNRPDLTAQRFLPNPFGEGRIYRTGDRVFWNKEDNLEYIGRMDNQVKLRGFRIELGEVEHALGTYESITGAAALVRDVGGNQALCAWFTANSPVDIDDLRRFLTNSLTDYMIPSFFLQMESLPLTANGKVDRKNLPEIEPEEDEQSECTSPSVFNRLENELADIIKKILGIDHVGLRDNLTRKGLTSLSTIELAIRIEKRFHVVLDVSALMRSCSLQDLEDKILEKWLANTESTFANAASEGPSKSGPESAPLTSSQLGIFYDCLKRPDSTAYNIPIHWKFPADFDADRLCSALEKVLANHPVFFSRLEQRGEDFVQVYSKNAAPEIDRLHLDSEEFKHFCEDFSKPFALTGNPLYRAAVVETPDEVALILDVHHIIADGFSFSLILHELSEVWTGIELPHERRSYADYAQEEFENASGPARQNANDFFANKLATLDTATEIEPDFTWDFQSGRLAEEVICIDPESVNQFCRSHAITPAVLFLAGSTLTLSRFARQQSIGISVISSGRNDPLLQNTVGMFVRTLPFCTALPSKGDSLDFLKSVENDFRETLANENVSFVELSAQYSFQPKVMFACELGIMNSVKLGEITPQLVPVRLEESKFPLSIHIEERGGQMAVAVQYNNALYRPFRMRMLALSLKQAVESIIRDSGKAISQISLIAPEQEDLLSSFRCPVEVPLEEEILPRVFENCADTNPNHTALIACNGTWTFAELDSHANQIANALIFSGVQKGDRVIFLLPRTGHILMAMFGILKTGAAFIPCDPNYPIERIRQIAEDSGAKRVITTSSLVPQFDEKGLDIETLLLEKDTSRPTVNIDPHDLAYLIYTSGSTGKPKGVMLEHRGICNYIMPHPGAPHVHAVKTMASALLSITTVSFDMSLKEILVSLCNGTTLVFADDDQTLSPSRLAELFQRTGADAFNATPSRLKSFLNHPEFREALRQLKIIMAGGEPFPKSLLDELRSITNAHIFNTYGPTEITVSCNCKELTHNVSAPVIGRPLPNVREFVIDTDGNELPPGAMGELYIGGPGVARGYVNLPDKTAAAFVQFQGERVYRSGDRAEWLENGDVNVHGRIDQQLKLRGLRIEANEVENALASCSGVKQSVVDVQVLNDTEYLCAWIAAQDTIDFNSLKSELAKHLPSYMIPAVFTLVESIPVNLNGKVDTKALPEPAFAAVSNYVPPRGETERIICEIFADVLKRPQIGALNHFFDLGGTSLSVTQVILKMEKQGLDVPYKDIFDYPTPRKLAKHLDSFLSNSASDDESFDYSAIDALLAENGTESYQQGKLQEIGSVLITGATGFLGVHFLAAFLDQEEGTAYCLVRPKPHISIEDRLKAILYYYFEDKYVKEIGRRIIVIPGSITDSASLDSLLSLDIDSVVNCAANVKHFSAHSDIEDVNYQGVQNLIEFCKTKGSRFVHISTTSVAGTYELGKTLDAECLTEQRLYFGQDTNNQYVHSKFLAERAILSAAAEGLSVKIMRVGNLSARMRDGEFQANFATNSFVGRLKAYQLIGKVPYSLAAQTAEFAPIDSTADAILRLLRTPEKCRVFHLYNPHGILFADIFTAMKECRLNIEFADDEECQKAYERASANPDVLPHLVSLTAYRGSQSKPMILVPKNNHWTLDILLRLGWKWPVISETYLIHLIDMLRTIGFFD